MSKSACILIGINYINTPTIRLRGCWNDAMTMYSMLISKTFNYPIGSMEMLMDNIYDPSFVQNKTSKAALTKSLYNLALKSWAENLDRVVVFYSGHGSNQSDTNGDEADGIDEGLCPADVMNVGLFLDDELLDIFNRFNPKTRIYVVTDCCHSGSILDLPYTTNSANDTKSLTNIIKPHIILVSGCRDPETAAETYDTSIRRYSGVMTTAISKLLEGQSLGLIDFHAKLSNIIKSTGFEQNIVMSSSRPLSNEFKMFL